MTFGGLRVVWVSALTVLAWSLLFVGAMVAGGALPLCVFVALAVMDAALAWVDALLWAGIVAEWRWRRRAVMRGEVRG